MSCGEDPSMNSSPRQISVRVTLCLNRRDRCARMPVGRMSPGVLYVRMATAGLSVLVDEQVRIRRRAWIGGVGHLDGACHATSADGLRQRTLSAACADVAGPP